MLIKDLNPVLQGWGNHFRTGNAAISLTAWMDMFSGGHAAFSFDALESLNLFKPICGMAHGWSTGPVSVRWNYSISNVAQAVEDYR